MEALYNFDYSVLNFIQEKLHNGIFDTVLAFLSSLADAGWFWIALAAILLFFKRTRKMGFVMGGALLMGVIVGNCLLKPIIARPRPYDPHEFTMLQTVTRDLLLIKPPHDFSFPSGHTLASFEGAVGIFICNKKWGIPALVLAVLIAYSRLYFYIHYPTDVFAGIILGTAFAIASYFTVSAIYKKVQKHKSSAH